MVDDKEGKRIWKSWNNSHNDPFSTRTAVSSLGALFPCNLQGRCGCVTLVAPFSSAWSCYSIPVLYAKAIDILYGHLIICGLSEREEWKPRCCCWHALSSLWLTMITEQASELWSAQYAGNGCKLCQLARHTQCERWYIMNKWHDKVNCCNSCVFSRGNNERCLYLIVHGS